MVKRHLVLGALCTVVCTSVMSEEINKQPSSQNGKIAHNSEGKSSNNTLASNSNGDNSAEQQISTKKEGIIDKILSKLGSSDKIDVSKGIDWGVLPGPFANPQQGVGLGIAAVGLYAPYDWKTGTPYSTLSLKSFVSTTGSFGFGVENRTYLQEDRLRLLGSAWISRTPRDYWGIGKQKGSDDDNKTEYQGMLVQLTPQIDYEILPHTYINVGWDFASFSKLKVNNDGKELSQEQLKSQINSGYSLGIEYDSRDFEPDPYSGMLLYLKYTDYLKSLGSDHNFQSLILNYRQYWKINHRNILAWEIYWQKVAGDIPWFAYAELGSDQRMRGYYTGRYRDRYKISGQVEWRHSFNDYHGMVLWAGLGNVAHHGKDLFRTGVLPTYGIGYRFAFKPRVNIRIDFGLGKKTSGFYFNINEAF